MLSVVIPTYNGRRFVGEALASVFAQTMLPDEVIVVDDASTDGTPEFVDGLAASAPVPLRVIRLSRNSGGPAHPTNVGIEAAAGEFIAILDQDDIFTPTKLQDQTRVLIDNPDVVFVFSSCGFYGRPVGETRQSSFLHQDLLTMAEPGTDHFRLSGARVLFLLMKYGCFVLGYPGFMFRRRDWEERAGLDETFRVASDYDILCWLSTRGAAAFVPKTVYLRREHGSNLSGHGGPTSVEGGIVLLRYFVAEKAAILRSGAPVELRESMLHAGYWLRCANRYRDALRAYGLAARYTGLDWSTVRDVCKLVLHWAWHGGGVRTKHSRSH